jgi:hypothetical protein
MATKSWKNISKFRLFTIVALSLLTSLSLTMTDELWKLKDIVAAIMQAAIAGFAYLQCPTIKLREVEENRKGEC